jgi:transmembrane sensor
MKHPHQRREDEIEAEAARWLARRDAGLTADEVAEFERWQATDPRHAAAVEDFAAMWTRIGRPRRTGVAAAVQAECHALHRRRRRRRAVLAAGACIVVLGLGLFVPPWNPGPALPASTAGIVLLPERRTLPDGSIVELKEGARITVSFEAHDAPQRRVVLHSGEAHFQVARDDARPFVVAAGHVAVRAVGTAFSVGRSSDRIDVLVTEGVVAVGKSRVTGEPRPRVENTAPARPAGPVSSDHDPAPTEWRLGAGNRMVVDNAANFAVPELQPVAVNELNERLAWRSPRVEFSRASLPEVVRVMNHYCRAQFRIADRELDHVRLSGRFRADDADGFARALERGFGIKAEHASATDIVLRRAD